jgi:cyclic-di-GMP-binding protein
MASELQHFETDPSAVDAWLEQLPIAHMGETARQLYFALRFANKKEDIAVKHHFHLLEGIAMPLCLVLPELHKHYAGKPLPLSQKRRKVADLYAQLLRQIILGYQHVIAHSIELNRFGWKKVVTTCVHRIFHFSSLLLCNYRLLYLPYQKGMWQQLYWIYQLIEKYELINSKILGLGEHATKSTLGEEFKKLLLYSLLSPNLFRQHELQDVISNMALWAQYVTIRQKTYTDETHTYAFTLETDWPPGMLAKNTNIAENELIDVRFLDISALLKFINQALAQSKQGEDIIQLTRQHTVTRRTMLILLNNWGRPASRDGERRAISGRAEVAIGVTAIHYVISEGRQEAPAQTTATPIQSTQDKFTIVDTELSLEHSEHSLLGFTAEHDKKPDVWDSAYFVPDGAPPAWTESMRMKVYSYLSAKVLNISKGGFCIAIPQDGVEHIQANELVAIRGKTGQWQLGEIRWMVCPTNGPIRAGIRKHCQSILPVQLHIQSQRNNTHPIKCLLGDHEDGKVLFLPNLPMALDDKMLLLELHGAMQKLSLLEQLYQTPAGTAYFVKLQNDQNTFPKSDKQPLDDYESIWASL